MITFDNGVRLIQDLSELPSLAGAKDVYADMETTSGHYQKTSFNPWHDCWVAGVAITVDDAKGAWYVPVGHMSGNVEHEPVAEWFRDIIVGCDRWINHNVKYDALVAFNCLGVQPECQLVDTVVLSKIIDSDRLYKGGYGLDVLSRDWLHEDISKYDDALKPYLKHNKDYGQIPADICGEYGGQDVLTNRRLWKYIQQMRPDQCKHVWDTEIKLTSVLFDMECRGMCVNPTELQIKELQLVDKLLRLDDKMCEIIGRPIEAHTNPDCYDVLCNQYGLPVLRYTEKGDPSFDKHALGQYLSHPYAPKELIELMLEYRQAHTLLSTFVMPYQELQIDGVMHGIFNQAVRTGRLSMKKPNLQQANAESKELIHPREGCSFLSIDASQIEFRLIAHYISDPDCIAAYEANPDTDFHQWVADLCGIDRKPAKNVNFAMAFGQGKSTTVNQLSKQMELAADLNVIVEKAVAEGKIAESQSMKYFEMLCKKKGEQVYDTYHQRLPSLKRVSRQAARKAEQRGYVFNLLGRRRHIPRTRAHIAFNTLNQGSAADIVKESMVDVHAYLKSEGFPVWLLCTVHDELLFEGPHDLIQQYELPVLAILEKHRPNLRVQLRWSSGIDAKNWKRAAASTSTKPKTLIFPGK